MKRILMFMAVSLMAASLLAQAPPFGMKGGYMFKTGSSGDFAMFTEGNINLMSKSKILGSDTITDRQVYVRLGGYTFDDVGYDSTETFEIQGINGHIMLEGTEGIFSIAMGGGGQYTIELGPDNVYVTGLLELSIKPFGQTHWLRLSVMGDYIPIPGQGDRTFVGAGLSIRP